MEEDMDEKLIIGVVISAAASYLLLAFIRRILDAINKASGGSFYKNKWISKIGIFFDTLLPLLPCIPSGFLTLLILSYWPPDDIWDNKLLYFCIGSLAGTVAAQIYQTITRGLEKRAERVLSSTEPPKPTDEKS